MSSNSSSDYGSSKSSSVPGFECGGNCVWTTNEDNFNKSVWWIVSNNGCDKIAPCNCLCDFPGRPPDFFGDAAITSCSCCPGCQWTYYLGSWGKVPNSDFCGDPSCDGDCPTPTHTPERNEAGLLQSYITQCGEIL